MPCRTAPKTCYRIAAVRVCAENESDNHFVCGTVYARRWKYFDPTTYSFIYLQKNKKIN